MGKNQSVRAGFTLLEMSVVVALIALVTGGFFMGAEMRKNAQLQSVGADYQKYVTAIGAFVEKYEALPGDMPDATMYWGDAGGSCGAFNTSTLPSTCNGNGDGKIGEGISNELAASAEANEAFLAWQHLGRAGLIQGNFDGRNSSSSNATIAAQVGITVPPSNFNSAFGWMLYYAYPLGNVNRGYRDYGSETGIERIGNVLTLGSGNGQTLTTSETAFVDQKYDDGVPWGGNIRIMYYDYVTGYGSARCSTMAPTAYPVSTSTVRDCPFMWRTGY